MDLGFPKIDSIKKGLTFIFSRQNGSFLWSDFQTFAGTSTSWVTGYILYKILPMVNNYDMRKAALALMETRHEGGWGYNETVPVDADSTAFATLGSFPLTDWTPKEIKEVSTFLKSHRKRGGYSTYLDPIPIQNYMGLKEVSLDGWTNSHHEISASVLMALKLLKVRSLKDQVRELLEAKKEDLWPSYWWISPIVSTALVLDCARAFNMIPWRHLPRIMLTVSALQNRDGGWGSVDRESCPFVTAYALDILAYGKEHEMNRKRGAKWLVTHQLNDGSWQSCPIMRIPPPDCLDPDLIDDWLEDGMGSRSLVRDQNRCFTTATVVSTLHRLGSLVK